MKQSAGWGCVLVGLACLAGCAGRGEVIPVGLYAKPSQAASKTQPVSETRVTITDFEDGRADRSRLGTRHSVWGADHAFQVKNGDPGEATARALTDYLSRKGWRVTYTGMGADRDPETDVVISGKILDLSVDSTSGLGFTDVVAKSKLVIQAKNKSDGSAITDTVSQAGTYSVFWFEPEDGEDIMSDVLEKSFEKFADHTKFDGNAVRFR